MFKKLMILVLSFMCSIVFISCANQKRIEPIPDINPNSLVSIHEVDDIVFEEHDYDSVQIDNPDLLCNTYMDVEPSFVVTLQLT